jgi:hypothetical protein
MLRLKKTVFMVWCEVSSMHHTNFRILRMYQYRPRVYLNVSQASARRMCDYIQRNGAQIEPRPSGWTAMLRLPNQEKTS